MPRVPAVGEPERLDRVDDRFWLALGAGLVRATIPGLTAQAERLATGVGWFWSVYVAALAVLGAAGARFSGLLGALPVVLLTLAYLLATWAQSPAPAELDEPRDPDVVRAAYARLVSAKRRRLALAYAALCLGGLGVAAAALSVRA